MRYIRLEITCPIDSLCDPFLDCSSIQHLFAEIVSKNSINQTYDRYKLNTIIYLKFLFHSK